MEKQMLENQLELYKVVGEKIILQVMDYNLLDKLDNKKEIYKFYKNHLVIFILLVSIPHNNIEVQFKVHIYQESIKLKDY